MKSTLKLFRCKDCGNQIGFNLAIRKDDVLIVISCDDCHNKLKLVVEYPRQLQIPFPNEEKEK